MSQVRPSELSDDELLKRVVIVVARANRLTAQLLELLIEVEERRLYLREACPTMFEYCVRRLDMSESAAYRRIAAARVVKRFPSLLPRVASGELNVTLLAMLQHHLTEENVEELIAATRGRSKSEVLDVLVQRGARPERRNKLRKLPTVRSENAMAVATQLRVESTPETRYRLEVTISRETRDKIEYALDLMSHSNPKRDLSILIERAVAKLVDELEKQVLGKRSRPAREKEEERTVEAAAETSEKTIPRAVRRKVFERDGAQCTYADDQGRRCPARDFLQIDHADPRLKGGTNAMANLRVRCGPHNRMHAEQTLGKKFVRDRIQLRQRKSRRRKRAKHAKHAKHAGR